MTIEVLPEGVAARMGGHLTHRGATFRVWAPAAREVYLLWGRESRSERPSNAWRLHKDGEFFVGFLRRANDGDVYRYWIVGPGGEGPKRDAYARELEWRGYPDCDAILRDPDAYPWASNAYRHKPAHALILYQLHVGTFFSNDANGRDARAARVGRFLDVLDRFEHLVALNITGIQLLPIVEWQTSRSLGYNGTDLYSAEMDHFIPPEELGPHLLTLNRLRAAVGASPLTVEVLASGVHQLKALIDLFHLYDIAVFFDVVYNHLGGSFDPQSIYLLDFHATDRKPHGPYFQNAGWAGGVIPDYAEAPVRRFLAENAVAMAQEYRIDGIRYDEVTVIDDHGGWGFCQELTAGLQDAAPHVINIAEYWKGDKSWVIRDREHGGAGFHAVWLDSIRDAIRETIAAAARGRSAWVDMSKLGHAFHPTFGDGEDQHWRALHYIENHDLHKAGHEERKPRIARLADSTNSRSWYGRSRSRVANALLLSAPGIPMLFMGQELLEDKYWSDNPEYQQDTLVWWNGLQEQPQMQQHLRFMQDFVRLRRGLAGLQGRYTRGYQTHDIDRLLVLLRGTGDGADDVVVIFSLNESPLFGYEVGFPHGGTWYELLNGDAYEADPNHIVRGNGGTVVASGPPRASMPTSARVTIPPNGVLVLGRHPLRPDEHP